MSAAILLLSNIAYFFIEFSTGLTLPWLSLIISELLLFVAQYFLIKYFLETFIYNKIKLIFKSIHSLKRTKDEKRELRASIKGDIINSVNEQVMMWVHDKGEEIDELKKLETYRREFLGNVSHELKTPLFNLQGFTLTLIDGGMNDPEINQDYLEKIQKNIERMITIVEDLEIISRLESGEARPVISRFDMVTLTKEVFEFLEPKLSVANISLILGNDHYGEYSVLADREKIREVLSNLIDNSIKYGKENGRTKVSFYEMDENVLIEVSDDGIGIREEHISRLFERFYRVDKHRSRSQGGSGLGLAIVKHIIEAHDQTVNVRSAPGVGSTFAFTLKKG
ncbi:MAG: sensor histidine kinase [Bacteroidales bacterium]|nr:sensor histidine kinase [Bacteroidales bacterium]MBK7174181.1 sensor histidine kinase [Bacteroidales bacterium]